MLALDRSSPLPARRNAGLARLCQLRAAGVEIVGWRATSDQRKIEKERVTPHFYNPNFVLTNGFNLYEG